MGCDGVVVADRNVCRPLMPSLDVGHAEDVVRRFHEASKGPLTFVAEPIA